MSISGSTINTTFSYDPNGNQTAGLGRTITYTSYNKPSAITQGARTISFNHDGRSPALQAGDAGGHHALLRRLRRPRRAVHQRQQPVERVSVGRQAA